jgi:DNA-binding response OmpR family regulator
VLIVEDDPALNRLMAFALTSAGYETVPAVSGTAALDELSPHPDVIVLDLLIPGIDGPTFLAEAMHLGFGGHVLVVSGADNGREVARLMGAEAYLAKPFTPEELVETVEGLLSGEIGPALDEPEA